MSEMPQALAYERVKIDSLKFDPRNARKHDDRNIKAIMDSLSKFGQQKAIVVGDGGIVIAGNGTLEAAKRLGWDTIDVRRSGLKADEATAYAIADNRSAELAEWDDPVLGDILGELKESGWELDDLGFNDEDLKDILKQEAVPGLTDEDEVPEVDQNEFGVKRGDIWHLGNHRLMCGDSTLKEDVEKLMNGEKADMVFTDPPYGVAYAGGHNKKKRSGIENDKLQGDDLTNLFYKSLNNAVLKSKENCAFYIWYANGKAVETFKSFANLPLTVRAVLCWYKVKSGLGAFMSQYIPNYEPCIYAFKTGHSPKWFGPSTEKTVWELKKESKNEFHPTQKPVELSTRAITNSSENNDIVLDLFLGSGATLIGCENTGRRCYGMELDEHYCSVIIKRWQDFTGKVAERIVEGA